MANLEEQLNKERSGNKKKAWVRKAMILAAVLAGAGILYLAFFNSNSGAKYEFVKVAKKDLKESIEVTGNVEAGATIALSFRDTGQVDQINFDAGDKVKKGDIIASLKNRDQELRLDQARANLQGAQANLNQKLAGSRSQEVKVADSSVARAKAAAEKVNIDFNNAKLELELIKKKYVEDEKKAALLVDDAKARADFALKNQTNTGLTREQAIETARKSLEAQLFSSGAQIQQSLVTLKSILVDDGNSILHDDLERLDYQKRTQARDLYYSAKEAFDPFYTGFKSKSNYTKEELKEFAVKEQTIISELLQAQKLVVDALSILPSSESLPESEITNLKNILLSDSSNVSNSLGALNLRYQDILDAELGKLTTGDQEDLNVITAKNAYDQQLQTYQQTKIDHQVDINSREARIRSLQADYEIQKAEIESAEANLDQVKVGPRAVDVAFLRADVAASQIGVSIAEESLEKTLLRAPVDGVLSRKNIDEGEDAISSASVSARQEGVFEMISDQKYKIEAEIAEVDINKIKEGAKAELTLDAVGDDAKFNGTITKIEPVQTVIQDVVFYKAEIVIDSEDERIRPGMTANVEIVLSRQSEALSVPEKAVQNDNGRRFVRILVGNQVKEVDIQTGIRDIQGNLEVKSGLVDGQEIILRTLNNGK